ncbi:MAG: ATP-dependent zinc metalloprotease FtsH, partial [Salinisphaera sp.]|uniref:ATP-dependent zinc metalloprotease FtsH n=1 Tax=Salinisphaera sp. TaxID=1914330 RepID=UPI003C7DFB3F
MNKKLYPYIWSVLIPVLVLITMMQLSNDRSSPVTLPYSAFQHELAQGHIKDVVVGQQSISGEFKQPQNGKSRFTTLRVPPDIRAELDKAGVTYRGAPDTSWIGTLLSWILPMGLFLGVWVFLMRRMSGGGAGAGGFMQVGKSRAKVYVETDTKVGFDDVAGVDEAKEELVELIEFLKDPKRYSTLGAHIPKGVLLVGPPGTGKTLLARAVAGEAEVPFFSISGSEFVEMFVGVGAARVRDLFQQARAKAPAIIFIDELDALGRARGVFHQGGNDEREQTLNQLLVELDGFDPSGGLVLLAATNRPEILDPALLRAGRFDRQVLVDRPDKAGRIQILRVHVKKIRLADDVALEQIAALTTGFTGADLANLVNEAALLATRRRAEAVTMLDFNNAIERIVAGLEKKNRILNPREREIVAHHEMGHALMTRLLPGVDPVHKVSIIPRGIGALGYTLQRPTEDRFLMTREELENKIAVLLGGRAAEKLVYGHLSTGAADDLSKATDLARSMVTRYGMDEQLGYVTYDHEPASLLGPGGYGGSSERPFSEQTADAIDSAVRAIIHDVFERVYAALEHNRKVL